MGKIIVFSNLKGGCGKSTLCCHFAHYLVKKNQQVCVLDADTSQNIYNMRQREISAEPDTEEPWKVWQLAGTGNIKAIMERAKEMDGYVLIDCPGTLSDKNLLTVFQYADVAVVPFRYDDLVVDSTISFSKVLKNEVPEIKIIYVPNIIRLAVKYPLEAQATDMFSHVGIVTYRITDAVAVQRISSLHGQDEQQENATGGAFNSIYEVVR
ncbi:MAG: ParA family protein [Paludibacteraceae bacterium]|nr:ParA family protein [Paludibacteraceae bacterium]